MTNLKIVSLMQGRKLNFSGFQDDVNDFKTNISDYNRSSILESLKQGNTPIEPNECLILYHVSPNKNIDKLKNSTGDNGIKMVTTNKTGKISFFDNPQHCVLRGGPGPYSIYVCLVRIGNNPEFLDASDKICYDRYFECKSNTPPPVNFKGIYADGKTIYFNAREYLFDESLVDIIGSFEK